MRTRPVTRPSLPFRGLAALLAAALVALAAGPAAAAVVDALGPDARSYCERMGHTMPDEVPSEAPVDPLACCLTAPEAPADAVVPAPPPLPDESVAVLATVEPLPPAPRPQAAPLDTGPPPGPRRHLTLSVLLV